MDKIMFFIFKGNPLNISKNCDKIAEVLNLKHPKNSCMRKFLLIDDIVYEITCFQQNKSMFIDEFTKSDDKLFFVAPIDPVFLVLPYLKSKAINQYCTLEDLLADKDYPDLIKIISSNGLKYLHLVVDEENKKFKYNEEKLMIWLEKKLKQLFEILQINRSEISWTTDSLIKEAKGILYGYLNNSISKSFSSREVNTLSIKRKSNSVLLSKTFKKQKP